jgi:hypothetical protein
MEPFCIVYAENEFERFKLADRQSESIVKDCFMRIAPSTMYNTCGDGMPLAPPKDRLYLSAV